MPFAFTEHGALMAASVLSAPRAVEVSLYVVRAFVELTRATALLQQLPRPRTDNLANLSPREQQAARQRRAEKRQE